MVDADGHRTDGRRLDGYTISSLCEPNGSGSLCEPNGSGELNQRTKGPVNAHLISGPTISTRGPMVL